MNTAVSFIDATDIISLTASRVDRCGSLDLPLPRDYSRETTAVDSTRLPRLRAAIAAFDRGMAEREIELTLPDDGPLHHVGVEEVTELT